MFRQRPNLDNEHALEARSPEIVEVAKFLPHLRYIYNVCTGRLRSVYLRLWRPLQKRSYDLCGRAPLDVPCRKIMQPDHVAVANESNLILHNIFPTGASRNPQSVVIQGC